LGDPWAALALAVVAVVAVAEAAHGRRCTVPRHGRTLVVAGRGPDSLAWAVADRKWRLGRMFKGVHRLVADLDRHGRGLA
jgi:hypothetical protein